MCSSPGIFAAVVTPPPDRNDAIVRFDAPEGEGRVLWATQRGTPSHPAAAGGFSDFAATARFVAWVYVETSGASRFYVADANGRNIRDLAPRLPGVPSALHADGDRLVFVAADDLWLYTASTGQIENLTNDRFAQGEPFLSGDQLVWTDRRDDPRPENPEVYAMNLVERVPMRITHDPPERPVYQEEPSVRGDWVVWNDLRHSRNPANRGDPLFTSEVYAYNLRTRREYPIATGDHTMGGPVIFDGQVYFRCATISFTDAGAPRFDSGLYRSTLPSIEGAP